MTALPPTPGPFPQEFLDALIYDPSAFLWDELVEIDRDAGLLRARLTVAADWPLIDAQRVDPVTHPQHMAGGLLLHATGTLGFAHAYWVLGLRPQDGWAGFATHIHRGVFRQLVPPGGVIEGTCETTRVGDGETRRFVRCRLDFRHEGKRCYEGDHSGVWMRGGG